MRLERWPARAELGDGPSATGGEGVAGFAVPTAAGTFGVLASRRGVVAVLFPCFGAAELERRLSERGFALGVGGRRRAIAAGIELRRYLSGEVTALSTPIDTSRLTPFRRDVYRALARVPCGATVTYGERARLAGHPDAARAVGAAMRANPTPIFVPCHRVVPAGGGLGGWSGPAGWKARLLALEGAAI
ncbi:MAG: methylated-DNA--[protein]-cysteine S-methyltransferase [Proteobacteria bacterium]|jgi:methylated-DNA-[protein]-cysteine S-methyltransferase|nr:methylated-DNA--[protein]-cysteine S-methyltransferase [Pseudomonadota bacterium]